MKQRRAAGVQAWGEAVDSAQLADAFKKATEPSFLRSTHPEGKSMLWDEVIPVLVSLLEDTDPEVQASATGALMFAALKPQGERQAVLGILSGNQILRHLSHKPLLPYPPSPQFLMALKRT